MARLWQWQACDNGKTVAMARLWQWQDCDNGKTVTMARLWQWQAYDNICAFLPILYVLGGILFVLGEN